MMQVDFSSECTHYGKRLKLLGRKDRKIRLKECVGCPNFPCEDVKCECYTVPDIEFRPTSFSIIMISETAPTNSDDYYYARGNPLFQITKV